MMYLHDDFELFKDVVNATSEYYKDMDVAIIEKDYYVTMILKLLSTYSPNCVFKGGTSLSKCYGIIKRFSEDIDISYSSTLSYGDRKRLKNNVIASISAELNLPIKNWEDTRSRRDYNCYIFDYNPIEGYVKESLIPGVKMEIVLSSLSFPVAKKEVSSLIYEFLKNDNIELIEKYNLEPFYITTQSLERTFVDKVFAICDYYLQGKYERHSRHIYDLYMLSSRVILDENLSALVKEVREQRLRLPFCPSAKEGVNINDLLNRIRCENYFEQDYNEITKYFQNEPLPYMEAIKVIQVIIESKIF